MAAQGKGHNRGRAKKKTYTTKERRALGRRVRGRIRIYHLNLPNILIGWLLCIPPGIDQSDSTSLIPTIKRLSVSITGSNDTVVTLAIPCYTLFSFSRCTQLHTVKFLFLIRAPQIVASLVRNHVVSPKRDRG